MSRSEPAWQRAGPRALLSASTLSTVGVLPVFLLGGLAVFIRGELGFSESQLGLTIAAYFLAATSGSVPAGWFADRVGARLALLTGAGVSVLCLLGAALAGSWAHLTVWLLLAGTGTAIIQVATNLLLAGAVNPRRQGLAFGVKQAAIPAATLLAGLAVPVLAVTVGWRWAFAAAALLAGVAGLTQALATPDARSGTRTPRQVLTGRAPLLVLAAAAGLGSGAANSMGTFLVEFTASVGVSPSTAGLVLAVGSAAGIAARVGMGWVADRMVRPDARLVAAQMGIGAIALLGLSGTMGRAALFGVVAVAFGAGWGWPGLLNYFVVRTNGDAPAAATGITQTGVYGGATVGPFLFGFTVEHVAYEAAWTGAAAAQAAAAVLVLVARRLQHAGQREVAQRSP